TKNELAKTLADALDKANNKILMEDRSPSRKVGELDNRGSHFYLALYWAQALAETSNLKDKFSEVAKLLTENKDKILSELNGVQGKAVDMGGYYHPDQTKLAQSMRPSSTFNSILEKIG